MKKIILFLGLILCSILSVSNLQAQARTSDQGERILSVDTTIGPVILSNDTLFYVYHPVGIYSARERSKRISILLNDILTGGNVEVDSFLVFPALGNHIIMYESIPVMAIYPSDTVGHEISPDELANIYVTDLKAGFEKVLAARNLRTISRNILSISIIIILVVAVVFFLNWIFRKIYRYLDIHKARFFKGLSIRNYQLFSKERQFKFIKNVLGIFKIGMIILIIFISLPIIFTKFPATEGVTRKLISLIWNPILKILLSIVDFIPNLISIVIIYFIFRYFVKGLKFLSEEISQERLVIPGFYPEWARPTFMISRFVFYIFMFVLIFPLLPGSDSSIFQGVSIFVGLLISIGSSSAIANAVAGIVITYMRPFKVGDRIKIDDIVGTVMEKSALVTRIRTIKNEDITIPNAKILTSYTVNYSDPAREVGLIIHSTVTIGYDAPWRTVHKLLMEAASKTNGVVKEPAPFVLQISLDDFYISYQINAYINNASNILKIRSDLHQNIQDAFNRGGVEIMSPHYRAERNGNDSTIPLDWEDATKDPGKDQGPEDKPGITKGE